jgi:hypothetical protein
MGPYRFLRTNRGVSGSPVYIQGKEKPFDKGKENTLGALLELT